MNVEFRRPNGFVESAEALVAGDVVTQVNYMKPVLKNSLLVKHLKWYKVRMSHFMGVDVKILMPLWWEMDDHSSWKLITPRYEALIF